MGVAKRLIARFKRRLRSLTTLAKTTNVPWILFKHLLMQKIELRVKPFVSRRNLNLASGSLKLSWALSKEKLAKPTSAFKRLNAISRSFNSKPMKITRTKNVCPSWPASFNKRSRPTRSKLRRLKKLPPLTWLNSARLNKILRKLRRDPKWPMVNFLFSVQALSSKATPAKSYPKEDPKYLQMYVSIYDVRNWEEEESKKMKNKLQLS